MNRYVDTENYGPSVTSQDARIASQDHPDGVRQDTPRTGSTRRKLSRNQVLQVFTLHVFLVVIFLCFLLLDYLAILLN